MKKRSLLALALVGTAVLTGCGKNEETPEVIEGYTGVATRVVEGESDSTQVEVTFENGIPVGVEIDVILEDGTSKHELSTNGEYVMAEDGMAWHEQIDALEMFLVDNQFDFESIPTIDEAGHVDAVSGVSISVGSYLTEVEELINQVEAGTYEAN